MSRNRVSNPSPLFVTQLYFCSLIWLSWPTSSLQEILYFCFLDAGYWNWILKNWPCFPFPASYIFIIISYRIIYLYFLSNIVFHSCFANSHISSCMIISVAFYSLARGTSKKILPAYWPSAAWHDPYPSSWTESHCWCQGVPTWSLARIQVPVWYLYPLISVRLGEYWPEWNPLEYICLESFTGYDKDWVLLKCF